MVNKIKLLRRMEFYGNYFQFKLRAHKLFKDHRLHTLLISSS